MIFANGHNHSCFSDGVYTPEELAALARKEGYKGIILTDHDTVRGNYYMQKAARKEGLLSITGCEFSTVGLGARFHLLGFDFDQDVPDMRRILDYGAQKQRKRTEILFHMAVEKGDLYGITWDEVEKAFPYNDFLCNNQVFHVLLGKGIMKEEDYFSAFLHNFSYRDKEREDKVSQMINMPYLQVDIVIKAILEAGGVPVLAHPHNKIQYIDSLLEMGLMGLEINHPDVKNEEREVYDRIVQEKRLYRTGGTDHNGVLGGLMHLDTEHQCDPEVNGIEEEDFMNLYQRKLG